MGFTAEFTAGLAQLLEDASVGAWKPTGSYTEAETAIVPGLVPAKPDRVITLTVYGYLDDPTQSESQLLLQVRSRGDRDIRTSENVQDAVFDVLQNLPRRDVAGVTVAGCWRRSAGYLGVDDNQRHSHSSNYEFRLHRPSPHRS